MSKKFKTVKISKERWTNDFKIQENLSHVHDINYGNYAEPKFGYEIVTVLNFDTGRIDKFENSFIESIVDMYNQDGFRTVGVTEVYLDAMINARFYEFIMEKEIDDEMNKK